MPIAPLLLLSLLAFAKTDVSVQALTTQAIITFDADDSVTACTIDVRESGAAAVVNDVNSSLYSGSNLDSRHAWNIGVVRRRIIVGARTLDRALAGYTLHTYSITGCVATPITGSFQTLNPPLGNTYPDLLPVDPANPGSYLLPTVPGSGAFSFVDPATGFKLFRLAKAYDSGLSLTACGDCDLWDNCWATKVAGPGGVMGYHCVVGRVIYWIDPVGMTANVIGTPTPTYNPTDGTHSGWSNTSCLQNYWVAVNSLLCLTYNPSEVSSTMHAFDTLALLMLYSGGNTDLGPLADTTPVTLCGSPPCWTVIDVTSATRTLSLNAMVRAATPEYDRAGFGRGSSVQLSGRMGASGTVNMVLRPTFHQDILGMELTFDPAAHAVTGIVQSYAVWPARWAGYHGVTNINDPTWVQSPNTQFRGALSGNDTVGNGPYISVTTASTSATSGACPAPGPLPVGSVAWPTGNHCTTIAVDGEPGDPSPAFYNTGTITTAGTAVTGTGTTWDQTTDQRQMKVGGTFYTFTWTDATHGTLSGSPGVTGSAYTIYLEPVNNSKTGNPLWGYLQDAAPGDVFFLSAPNTDVGNLGNSVGYVGSGYSTEAEVLRLLSKITSTSWLFQRGWSGDNANPKPSAAWASGSWLSAEPATCTLGQTSPCTQSQSYWNTTDTTGANLLGTTIITDPNDLGCCHGTFQNGAAINLGNLVGITIDGLQPWHWARNAAIPALFSTTGYPVTQCGPFHGLLGECVSNPAETHPSHTNLDTSWVTDGRPYDGSTDGGSAGCPATLVSGSLYTFSASSNCLTRLRRRVLPTMASCGYHPLLDISSIATGNVIGTTSGGGSDQWKYCVALHVNECRTGSAVGDVFMNCPGTTKPYSEISNNGTTNPTGLDINITDMGSVTHAITQTVVTRPDIAGAGQRRLTYALGQWKRGFTAYWHPECLPGGELCFVYITNGSDTVDTIWAVRMLPLPAPDSINRGDFASVTVSVKPAAGLTVDNMIVRYGYDSSLQCTTRQERCVAGATTGIIWESEAPAGVSTVSGVYTVTVPALHDRPLFTQAVLRSESTVVRAQPIVIQAVQ